MQNIEEEKRKQKGEDYKIPNFMFSESNPNKQKEITS